VEQFLNSLPIKKCLALQDITYPFEVKYTIFKLLRKKSLGYHLITSKRLNQLSKIVFILLIYIFNSMYFYYFTIEVFYCHNHSKKILNIIEETKILPLSKSFEFGTHVFVFKLKLILSSILLYKITSSRYVIVYLSLHQNQLIVTAPLLCNMLMYDQSTLPTSLIGDFADDKARSYRQSGNQSRSAFASIFKRPILFSSLFSNHQSYKITNKTINI
ncbi:Reverse transcriptase domain-containing protein, partial [Aphis craccivora]